MHASNQEKIFIGERVHSLPTKIQHYRSLEKRVSIEIDGVKPGQNSPLHLDNIFCPVAVQRALITGSEISVLFDRCEVKVWCETQVAERFLCRFEVGSPDQDIHVSILSRGDVSVEQVGQQRTFIRQRRNTA